MNWKVIETKLVVKESPKLPKKVRRLYRELFLNMENEGPTPFGWDSAPLRGTNSGFRIKLVREYRVIIEVHSPNIIVVKVAHRKEAYR